MSTIISPLRLVSLFCLCLFCFLLQFISSSHSTVAQQRLWSPFNMLCRFCYSLVPCRVLIVSVRWEGVNSFVNKCQLLNILKSGNNAFCFIGLWPLQIPTFEVILW